MAVTFQEFFEGVGVQFAAVQGLAGGVLFGALEKLVGQGNGGLHGSSITIFILLLMRFQNDLGQKKSTPEDLVKVKM